MASESPCDTNQVSVGDCWGWVCLKVVIGGHFPWCLTVTQDRKEAEQQHPTEHPRAVHGTGWGGSQEETKWLGDAGGLHIILPEPLLFYRQPKSSSLPTGGIARWTSCCWSHSEWRQQRTDLSPKMILRWFEEKIKIKVRKHFAAKV